MMNLFSGIYSKLAGLLALVGTGLYVFFLKSDRDNLKEENKVQRHSIDLLNQSQEVKDEIEAQRIKKQKNRAVSAKENETLLENMKHEDDNPTVVANIKRLLKHKDKD